MKNTKLLTFSIRYLCCGETATYDWFCRTYCNGKKQIKTKSMIVYFCDGTLNVHVFHGEVASSAFIIAATTKGHIRLIMRELGIVAMDAHIQFGPPTTREKRR